MSNVIHLTPERIRLNVCVIEAFKARLGEAERMIKSGTNLDVARAFLETQITGPTEDIRQQSKRLLGMIGQTSTHNPEVGA